MTSHPAFARIAGTWGGSGFGEYPTIDDFEYREETEFGDVGKPFLAYSQRTWSPDGTPMHVETGYLRLVGDWAEFTIAQPTGQAELLEGHIDLTDERIVLQLTGRVLNTSTAKNVEMTKRRFVFAGNDLTMNFSMAAVGCEMTRHLTAQLMRNP